MKTITKEIFDSYIANDSDSVLEGAVTNTFGSTTFWRFVRVPLAKGEHYVEALYEQDFGSFPLAMGANHFRIKNVSAAKHRLSVPYLDYDRLVQARYRSGGQRLP